MSELKGGRFASFAVGHMALAYLLGKASAKPFNLNPNVPLLLVLSILPDIDILFERILQLELHRGPTHSIAVAILVFVPFFIVYRQRALPYFLAFASHTLVGDFLIGGQIQLLWPFSTTQWGLHELGFLYIGIFDPININLELTLFLIATIILFKSNNIQAFFKKSKLNFILIIPIFTVLLPTLFGYPFSEPLLFTVPQLALPHLFYLLLFSIAIVNLIFPVYAYRVKNRLDEHKTSGTVF